MSFFFSSSVFRRCCLVSVSRARIVLLKQEKLGGMPVARSLSVASERAKGKNGAETEGDKEAAPMTDDGCILVPRRGAEQRAVWADAGRVPTTETFGAIYVLQLRFLARMRRCCASRCIGGGLFASESLRAKAGLSRYCRYGLDGSMESDLWVRQVYEYSYFCAVLLLVLVPLPGIQSPVVVSGSIRMSDGRENGWLLGEQGKQLFLEHGHLLLHNTCTSSG